VAKNAVLGDDHGGTIRHFPVGSNSAVVVHPAGVETMIGMNSRRVVAVALAATLFACASVLAAQDDLVRAKELYLTAEYDEALAMLNRLGQTSPPEERTEVETYRIFCLLALDKRDEARGAIQKVVTTNPFFKLPEAEASPRIQTTFRDIRRQAMPSIVSQAYETAKAAYQANSPDALEKFDAVIRLLDDADAAAVPNRSDLRTLASGFRELSAAAAAARAAAAPPPAAVAPLTAANPAPNPTTLAPEIPARPPSASPVNAAGAPRPSPSATPAAGVPAAASTIVPPVAISQPLPPWQTLGPLDRTMQFKGSLAVTVDQTGSVKAVSVLQSVHPRYDDVLVKAAFGWKYTPATKNGVPIDYVKVVDVRLVPR